MAAADHLALILDARPDLEALTRAISPSGKLSARISWQRSGGATVEVLRQWEKALGLKPGQPETGGTVTCQASRARRNEVPPSRRPPSVWGHEVAFAVR
jgi:hypothetical protein